MCGAFHDTKSKPRMQSEMIDRDKHCYYFTFGARVKSRYWISDVFRKNVKGDMKCEKVLTMKAFITLLGKF